MVANPSAAKSRKRWIALAIVAAMTVLGIGAIQAYRECVNGPSAEEAFRRYVKTPIPNSVTDLKIHYRPHMRGYWLYLVFRVDPGDLDSLFDFHQFHPAQSYPVDDDGLPVIQHLEGFRQVDPEGFNEMRKGEHLFGSNSDEVSPMRFTVVISKDRRKVYYYRFRD